MAPAKAPATLTSGGVIFTDDPPKPGIPLMSEQQWDRIYRHVVRIKQPTHRWENFAWSMLALAVSSALALGSWWQTNQSLDSTAQAAAEWQGWLYGFGVVSGVVLMVVAIAAHKGRVNQLTRDKEDVLEEMREFHMPLCLKTNAHEPATPPEGGL